jgi:hypothetical protein
MDLPEIAKRKDLQIIKELLSGLNNRKLWLVKYVLPLYHDYKQAFSTSSTETAKLATGLRSAISDYRSHFDPNFRTFTPELQEKFSNFLQTHKIDTSIEEVAQEFNSLVSAVGFGNIKPFRVASKIDILYDALKKFLKQYEYPEGELLNNRVKRENPKRNKEPNE